MRTVSLGGSGAEVSALCLGTMYFGTKTDEATSVSLLDQYVEAGGSFIDTANAYAHWIEGGRGGESELLLSRWLRDRGNRQRVFLATKVGFGFPGTEQYPGPPLGLKADQIVAECEKSLRRLGVDVIDLYYAHHDDRDTPIDETLEALSRLVADGKVKFLGASNHVSWRLADALALSDRNGWARYICAQQKHSYLRPNHGVDFKRWPPANAEFLDLCKSKGLIVVAYSPLMKGAYVRTDRPIPATYLGADTDARLAALRRVAEEKCATMNQVVLAWMMHSDPTVVPLFSASTPEQLAEDVGAMDVVFGEDEMKLLDEASSLEGA